MALISHVNLSIPQELMEAEAAFLTDILEYRELNAGASNVAVGTRWFEYADRSQIHLNVHPAEREFQRGSALGHIALQIDDLALFRDQAARAGVELRNLDADAFIRNNADLPPEGAINVDGIFGFIVFDPAGNIWEIRAEYPYEGLLETA